ncbi:MFS transporter [Paenibacillus sp. JCM 10914]|uniref:MFS transporter n=1 Tax=Paenibacillus sp. JCM 10914 TaxID=1236974 RepID=UPI0003CC37C4|nr:MFS transporter [Paenibacillus sp. JCM 10914]GAE07987.1 major facilitator superfamily MFS_1 [Paenibacillus sp. JCM 10914]
MSEHHQEAVVPETAGMRQWLGLGVLALATLLLALDFSVLHLALPHVVADLQPSSTQQLWILDIYGFMLAGFLVTMGTLGDRIGRKRLLMIGAALFGLCSIAAAYSVSAEMLIITRALLGMAGATLMPSTLSLIGNMFRKPKQRGIAIAVWLSCFSAGGAIGPLIGGLMLQWFWWGSVFLLGVPVMLVLLLTAPFLLPEFRSPQAGKLDLPSVVISLVAVLSVIYALKEIASYGIQPFPIAMLILGIGSGYIFIRRQQLVQEPLLNLTFFRNRTFNGALIGLLISVFALGGFVLFFAQYLQLVEGLTPLKAGLWMIPYALANIVGAMMTPSLANRMSASKLIALGLALASFGFLFYNIAVWLSLPGLAVMVSGSILIMLGLSPLMVLSTDRVVASVPPEQTGSASSLSEMSSEMGMALGIAILGTVGTATYRRLIAGAIPENTPAEMAEAVGDSLAGAVAATESFTDPSYPYLMEAAREAFSAGIQVVGVVSAVLLIGLIILNQTVFRTKSDESQDNEADARG